MGIPNEEFVAKKRPLPLLPYTAQQDHERGGEDGPTTCDEHHQQKRQKQRTQAPLKIH